MSGQAASSIVVFASGRGSNFRALCERVKRGTLPARIEALVTNVKGAGACDVAREFGVPVLEIPHQGFSRSAHENAILSELERFRFDWIVLAGYMRLLTPELVNRFRIVNIHPSLLPAFAGQDGYAQALRYGVKVTGVTVHIVSTGLDDGPIVAQETLDVKDDDDESSLSARGLQLEHRLYGAALKRLMTEPWRIGHGALPGGRPRVIFEGASVANE